MKSAQLNILIETGADFVLPFTVYDDNDQPIDLTGAKVEAQLREYSESPDCYEFICSHNGTGGRITLTMPNEVSSLISYTYGVYDVKVVLADGTTSYPLNGNAEIRDGVTKPIDGTMLYMIGIATFDDLPTEGIVNRLYFCYDDRKIYRWNGQNYIATAVGNGIQRVDFVCHQDEFTDIFRIYFDDGNWFEYTIFSRGIERIEKIRSSGDETTGVIDTYRMYFNTGTYWDYQIQNGKVMYATFEIDWDTGHLVMVTYNMPRGLFPDFALRDNGHLVMDTEPETVEE